MSVYLHPMLDDIEFFCSSLNLVNIFKSLIHFLPSYNELNQRNKIKTDKMILGLRKFTVSGRDVNLNIK